MPSKTGKKSYSTPKITDLGDWPAAAEKFRERALAQGMDPREIDIVLDEIREARNSNLKSTDDLQ